MSGSARPIAPSATAFSAGLIFWMPSVAAHAWRGRTGLTGLDVLWVSLAGVAAASWAYRMLLKVVLAAPVEKDAKRAQARRMLQ